MEKFTVPQLKDPLKKCDLSCRGLKADLIKRLLEAEGVGAEGGGRTEGGGAEGGEPGGGATEGGRKRKADVLGRGRRRKSKPTHGFMSGGSDNDEEELEAAGENLARKTYKDQIRCMEEVVEWSQLHSLFSVRELMDGFMWVQTIGIGCPGWSARRTGAGASGPAWSMVWARV